MKQEFSIPSLAARITTEADAYKLLEELRWQGGTPDACPHCGAVEKFYFLAPKDGTDTRKTRTGADTARRLKTTVLSVIDKASGEATWRSSTGSTRTATPAIHSGYGCCWATSADGG